MRIVITETQLRRLAPELRKLYEFKSDNSSKDKNAKPAFATTDDAPAYELIEMVEKLALKNSSAVQITKDISPDTATNKIEVFDVYNIQFAVEGAKIMIAVKPRALHVTKHALSRLPAQDATEPQIFAISDEVAKKIREKCEAMLKYGDRMVSKKDNLVSDIAKQIKAISN